MNLSDPLKAMAEKILKGDIHGVSGIPKQDFEKIIYALVSHLKDEIETLKRELNDLRITPIRKNYEPDGHSKPKN